MRQLPRCSDTDVIELLRNKFNALIDLPVQNRDGMSACVSSVSIDDGAEDAVGKLRIDHLPATVWPTHPPPPSMLLLWAPALVPQGKSQIAAVRFTTAVRIECIRIVPSGVAPFLGSLIDTG